MNFIRDLSIVLCSELCGGVRTIWRSVVPMSTNSYTGLPDYFRAMARHLQKVARPISRRKNMRFLLDTAFFRNSVEAHDP